MNSMNFWPILVASVVAFGVSAFWYSPILFGKEWMKLSKISDMDISDDAQRGMWKLYLTQFVLTLVIFCILGFIITATGSRTASDGVFLATLIWIGFAVTSAIGGMLWQKTPLKLVLITELCTLITWIIGGAILGAWR